MQDVVVMGASISARLTAAYLKKTSPDLSVTVVGPSVDKQPIVGESLTEFSSQMLHNLGLTNYLETSQFHKYGLTFYFKESLENPADRTYSVHEALATPPLPSYQLNRFTLARELSSLNERLGVQTIHGKVADVAIDRNFGHQIVVKRESQAGTQGADAHTANDKPLQIRAKWVVDATGRRRLLAGKLGLKQKAPFQRSAFWFRLVDFDRDLLSKIDAVKPPQIAFDSYYVTHHFMGRHNWVWGIPLKSDEHETMMSVGVVWRPDLITTPINSMALFREHVSREHPVVRDLVDSGTVLDENFYSNYLYEATRVYSADRWAIVGDAGDAVDPLYSTGLVLTSVQITQVAEMIERDQAHQLDDEFVGDLEGAYKTIRTGVQTEISTLYEVMHDPYQCHWRMHLTSTQYFFFLLPALLNGYLRDAFGARLIVKMSAGGQAAYESFLDLLRLASARLGALPASEIRNWYDVSVNWGLWCADEKRMPLDMARMLTRLARFRWRVLRQAGFKKFPTHLKYIAQDLVTASVLAIVFRGRALRRSPVLHSMLGLRGKKPKAPATLLETPRSRNA